ncbi:TRAP transporter small permease [Desulfoscipio sp. XC116]|uniref:TRAP transporter small permease n=1 Tax=Desulfoscipio sp. XC116 TaxID=3144975 RepID=UPI00325B120A
MLLAKINRGVEKCIKPAIGYAILLITLILCFNVIGRYIFGFSLKWAEELTTYTLIWVTFLGAVVCVREGMMISMDAFVTQLKGSMKRFFVIATNLICVVFSLIIAYLGIEITIHVYSSMQVSPAMMIPMYIPYAALPLGSILMALEYLEASFAREEGGEAKC